MAWTRKLHLIHQKWNRKGKTKPQFCLHFILKHKFWDCVGYDSMKISTLLSIEDPDNYLKAGVFTSAIYDEDCIFEDPTIKFQGKNLWPFIGLYIFSSFIYANSSDTEEETIFNQILVSNCSMMCFIVDEVYKSLLALHGIQSSFPLLFDQVLSCVHAIWNFWFLSSIVHQLDYKPLKR